MLARRFLIRLPGVSTSALQQQQREVHHHMERSNLRAYLGIERSNPAKANRNTHVNEKKFRRLRGKKTVLMDLPDHEEQQKLDALPPDQLRAELLKKGINPYKDIAPRSWQEAQITNSSFYAVIDPYVKLEEKVPIVPMQLDSWKAKASETKDRAMHAWHGWRNGTRRIKRKQGFESFNPKTFGPTAEHVYTEAYKALIARNKGELLKVVTEHAFQKMWPDVDEGSIKWELVEVVEPHKVVSVRCSDMPYGSGNDIAQVTVRMHTRQKLALFDRFGKIILGSETQPREIVEYAVFENHIAVVDGKWRLHDKVYPRWLKPKQPALATNLLQGDSVDENRPSNAASLPLRITKNIEEEEKAKKAKPKEK